jgi:2-polyprenyl-3-methyl-5-hydroxy-6-metoxy-1,4-benzoquinol methylase
MTVLSPLSHTDHVKKIKDIDVKTHIKRWAVEGNLAIEQELDKVATFAQYQCLDSGLTFYYPAIAGSEHLYQHLQEVPLYYASDKIEYRYALKDLKHAHRILEIGAGNGQFMAQLKAQGKHVIGLEFNTAAIAIANANGHTIYNTPIETFANTHEQHFDAVCSFQVLEHVEHPRDFLAAAVKCLKPNGLLILAVPSGDGYLRHYDSIWNTPPHHLHHWPKTAFLYLEKILPVQLIRLAYEPLTVQEAYNYRCAFDSRHQGRWYHPWAKRLLKRLLKTRARGLFKGHSVYVVYNANHPRHPKG